LCYNGDMIHKIIDPLIPLAVSIDTLHTDPANARRGHAIDKIAASLEQYGQRKPIVVNASEANKVEAGNGTLQAAKQLGWTHIAAVTVEDDALTAVGYGIADNRLSELSEWDDETLATLLQSLDLDDVVTGFDDSDLADLLAEIGQGLEQEAGDAEPQTDRADELREKWGVELGQMWRLPSRTPGQEHRLICGDCTDGAVVERVMGGEKADIGVTSPPYSVGKDYETDSVDDWRALIDGVFSCAPTSSIWINLANKRTGNDGYERNTFFELAQIAELHKFKMIGLRVWVKDPTWAGQNPYWRNTYKPVDDFEFIALFVSSKPKHIDRLTSEENNEWGYRGVWDFGSVSKNRLHSAAYPLELPERCLKLTSDNGAIVYEPFSGSGTTIIAAENLARQCRAVEISPAYVAVALQRYVDAFGIEPELIN
jgi:DNA modification methylase